MDELHLRDPGHDPTSNELLLERSIANVCGPCSTELEQSRIEETHATQSKIPANPVYYSKEVIPVGEWKSNDIPAFESFKGHTYEAEVSKLVMRLARHHDQDERETDGAVHWNSMVPKLRKASQKAGGRKHAGNICRKDQPSVLVTLVIMLMKQQKKGSKQDSKR